MLSSASSLTVGSSAIMLTTMSNNTLLINKPLCLHNNNNSKPLSLPNFFNAHSTSIPLNSISFFNAPPSSTASFITAVAATDSDQLSSSSDSPDKQQPNKYHFVVANAKFMLDEEEHFKELLYERLRYFGERNRDQDFWLVIEPKFLDKFPDITKRLGRPAVALVSTDATWITYMKLRLDRVLSASYEAENVEEALASNPTNIEFEKPANWVAPYKKYEYGWWETFLPAGSKESKV
ncbi:hypothetical protein ACFE04_011970 [Oxalis oulophora]